MTAQEEIEMLKLEKELYHNAFANLLNAYNLISSAYFRLATEKAGETYIPLTKGTLRECEVQAEELMKENVPHLKFKDLPRTKKSASYLG